ncbi:MAG: FAD-binding oxidoreductase [Candidatus Korarchaeota archaeon]
METVYSSEHRTISPDIIKELVNVLGEENVFTTDAERYAHGRDFWLITNLWFLKGKIPAYPGVVVYPSTSEEVSEIVKISQKHKIPIVPYGGGSGVLGGAIPIKGGIVIDLKKMNKFIEISDASLTATVESGMNGWRYEEYLNYKGYTGGHIPQSLPDSTVGGWIACRAAGQYSTKYGKIEDIVVAVKAIMPDGSIVESRKVPRSSTGPRLEQLLLGSEGTLGIITEATLRIWPYPERRVLLSYSYETLEPALESVRMILRKDVRPAVVRIHDPQELELYFSDVAEELEGRFILIFVIEGNSEVVDTWQRIVEKECVAHGGRPEGEKPVQSWLKHRFDVHAATESTMQGAIVDTIEISGRWEIAADLYHKCIESLNKLDLIYASGHYSHFYTDGVCLYLTFGGFPEGDVVKEYEKMWDGVMRITLELGGSISHHHGIGIWRMKWLKEELGEYTTVISRIKKALEPAGVMNTGKIGGE